jgi:branched-chain amino acid transport system permease protein
VATDVLIVTQALYLGCVYALIAMGLTIIYSATKVINFAQGEYFILGAALAYQLSAVEHLPLWLTFGGAVLAGAAVGAVTERAIMLPVLRSGVHFAWIISTLAVALILESIYEKVFSSAVLHPDPYVTGSIRILGAAVDLQVLFVIAGAFVVMLAYEQFLSRTAYGRAIRATAHDPDTASSLGIGVRWVILASFVFSAVITAIAGLLVAPILLISPGDGLTYTINGFVAMVIGGLGSSRGSIAGGLIVGLLNALVVNLFNPNYGEIVIVSILALILIIRPTGLFGSAVSSH